MAPEELIEQILAKQPEITREQVLAMLQSEKSKTGGLLSDETLLRCIAVKYGVALPINKVYNESLSSGNLFAGLNDVTVSGRLIAVFPVKTFQGEKSGKFTSLMMVDNDGVLRVVLWNEKADFVEKGLLKAGEIVKFSHGYTREDRYGKIELHLSAKGQIEIISEAIYDYPNTEKFSSKIGELDKNCKSVILSGVVKEILGSTVFIRSDMTDGLVMRFLLADESGVVKVVVWNEKAEELKMLKPNTKVHLVNPRVKENQNGGLEVHIDSNTFVNIQ